MIVESLNNGCGSSSHRSELQVFFLECCTTSRPAPVSDHGKFGLITNGRGYACPKGGGLAPQRGPKFYRIMRGRGLLKSQTESAFLGFTRYLWPGFEPLPSPSFFACYFLSGF